MREVVLRRFWPLMRLGSPTEKLGEKLSHVGGPMRQRFLDLFTEFEDVWVKPRSGMGNGGKVYGLEEPTVM